MMRLTEQNDIRDLIMKSYLSIIFIFILSSSLIFADDFHLKLQMAHQIHSNFLISEILMDVAKSNFPDSYEIIKNEFENNNNIKVKKSAIEAFKVLGDQRAIQVLNKWLLFSNDTQLKRNAKQVISYLKNKYNTIKYYPPINEPEKMIMHIWETLKKYTKNYHDKELLTKALMLAQRYDELNNCNTVVLDTIHAFLKINNKDQEEYLNYKLTLIELSYVNKKVYKNIKDKLINALTFFTDLNMSYDMIETMKLLSCISINSGDYGKAIEYLSKAIYLADEIKIYNYSVCECYSLLSFIYINLMMKEKSITIVNKGIELCTCSIGKAHLIMTKGNILANNFDSSLLTNYISEYYEALLILDTITFSNVQTESIRVKTYQLFDIIIESLLQNYNSKNDLLSDLLSKFFPDEFPKNKFYQYMQKEFPYLPQLFETNLEKMLKIHRDLKLDQEIALDLYLLAVSKTKMNELRDAENLYNESLTLALNKDNYELLWKIYYKLALLYQNTERRYEAVHFFDKAVNIIESVRAKLSMYKKKNTEDSFIKVENLINFNEGKRYVYEDFIYFLLNLHQKNNNFDIDYAKKSLNIFELKQGRVFSEQLGKSGARYFANIPEILRNKELLNENQLSELQYELMKELSKNKTNRNFKQIQQLEKQIERTKKTQLNVQDVIMKKYPDYYALKYPEPANLLDIQEKILKAGEIMLVYNVMRHTTCLWVISQDNFDFISIAVNESNLNEKVDRFRSQLNTILKLIKSKVPSIKAKKITFKSKKKIDKVSYELYNLLVPNKIRPIISKATVLYIIPTYFLYGLPFEALVTRIDDQNVRYFVQEQRISYLSSVSLLKIIRETQERKSNSNKPSHKLLAFANPVYSDRSENDLQFNLIGEKLSELPETETEVKEINKIFGDSQNSLQLRDKASISNIYNLNKNNKLEEYRYIIFSCHGFLPNDANRILQPTLLLTHPDPITQKDGFLTMADVFELKFNANLVYLSTCNSGRGKLIRGEGVMGFTRAFMFAGTPAVSVTLWPVELKSSSILSIGLFSYLEKGKSSSEALQKIKIQMISGKKGELYRHPFFWASVVMFGDGLVD